MRDSFLGILDPFQKCVTLDCRICKLLFRKIEPPPIGKISITQGVRRVSLDGIY